MSAEKDDKSEGIAGTNVSDTSAPAPVAAPTAAVPAAAPEATSASVDSGLTVTRTDIEEAATAAMDNDSSQLTRSSLGSTGNKDAGGRVDLTDTIVASLTEDGAGEDGGDQDVAQESSSTSSPTDETQRRVAWPQDPLEYLVGARIGRGAFAEVRHALRKEDKAPCAIKIIKLENLGEGDNTQLQDEIFMMLSMKHPNVLSCHAVFQTRRNHVDELWVVMPFMDLGSALRVLSILKQNGSGEGCGEMACKALMESTLKGLEYLHNQGIVHRDIKAGNILLDSSGAVCIADFGVSSWLRDKLTGVRDHCSGQAQTFVGTPCWMAPEVMEQNGGYNTAADVWSFGITSLELAKGCAPYYGLAPMAVVVKTLQDDPPTLKSYPGTPSAATDWAHRSSAFKRIISACLKRDPVARKKVSEVLRMPFVRPHRNDGSDHKAAIRALVKEVGCINVSHVAHTTEGIKDEETIKSHIAETGTGRSLVMSKDTNWDFGDVDDFEDDYAKQMGGLSTIEEQEDKADEAAAILAATNAKEEAEAAAAAAAKALEEAKRLKEKAKELEKAAAEANAITSSNPDDFGDFFEASTRGGI